MKRVFRKACTLLGFGAYTSKPSENDDHDDSKKIQLGLFPEYEVLKKDTAMESFSVLMRVKASEHGTRAPIDLVTVIDVSASMAGMKLDLVKRAMTFLISNLGPQHRLSVVTFSGTAKCLFPMSRMTRDARRTAITSMDKLYARGNTIIADGLKAAAKTMSSRRFQNPVSAIMLFSDGQDNRDFNARTAPAMETPVYTFGFGSDHDAATLHLIAERSGGTFSYLQNGNAVMDAFAQCLGGLLSVTVQDLSVRVSTSDAKTRIKAVHAGSYKASISESGSDCIVKLGDLYAGEGRDVLLDLNLTATSASTAANIRLISVNFHYRDAVSTTDFNSELRELSVRVSDDPKEEAVKNPEVDAQQRRVRICKDIAEATEFAELGDISGARAVLKKAHADLCNVCEGGLESSMRAEVKEMLARLMTWEMYQRHGRALFLSSMSSYSWQRATTRGSSNDDSYQTSSMTKMISLFYTQPR